MTWGIVCCQWQFDPCWIPRQITHILCFCIPCGCIAEETILTVCCCNPGEELVSLLDDHIKKEGKGRELLLIV